MAGKRQVVAWISKAEWEQVLEYLYSRDTKLQREALHQITAWKSRYGNSMPLAVECTADLVRCKILDMSGGMGEQELALLYGLALVRFVNIITGPKQKTIAIPLRRLANELNIPEWVITLRHSATHGKLPKLNMCRKGWDFVMEWLRREYWSRQLGNTSKPRWVSEDEEDSEEMEDVLPSLSIKEKKRQAIIGKLRETLHSYASEQFKIFQDHQNNPKSNKSWNCTSGLEWIIAQVKELIQQSSSQTAAAILVEDGLIIPTAKQLVTLQIEQYDPDGRLLLPRTLLKFWQPLLKTLHSPSFTQELLVEMFAGLRRCQDKNADTGLHCLSSWIAELLTANHKADGKPMLPSRNQAAVKGKWKLFSHRVPLQWKQLMKKCLEFPCRTTPRLLRLIFSYMKPRLPLSTQEQLLCLCSIYIQDDADVSVDYSDQPIYTVESLQWKIKQDSKAKAHSHWGRASPEADDEEDGEDMNEHIDDEMITETYEEEYIELINMKAASERKDALEGSAWGVSSGLIKWSEYPLGVVPGQSEDPSCLLTDSYSMMSVLEQQGSASRRNGQSIPMSSTAVPASSDNSFWSQAELNHIKAGLRLF